MPQDGLLQRVDSTGFLSIMVAKKARNLAFSRKIRPAGHQVVLEVYDM